MTINELYHHGILGQAWGKRNGPPYPLPANKHSPAEQKAGWKASIKKDSKFEYKGGTQGGGSAQPTEEIKEEEYDPNDPDWKMLEDFDDPEEFRKYRLTEDSSDFLIPHEDGTYAILVEGGNKIVLPKNYDVNGLKSRLKTMEKAIEIYDQYKKRAEAPRTAKSSLTAKTYDGKTVRVGKTPHTADDYDKWFKQAINGKQPDVVNMANKLNNTKAIASRNRKGITAK